MSVCSGISHCFASCQHAPSVRHWSRLRSAGSQLRRLWCLLLGRKRFRGH
jgi:hypothetical protein